MPAIEHITVHGFKSIRSLEKLSLRPVNVLIGPNGSGKSNFIGVFEFLQAIRAGRLRDYVGRAGGADRMLHFGAKITNELGIHVAFENEVNQYEITLSAASADALHPSLENGYFWNKEKHLQPYSNPISGRDGEAGISRSDAGNIAHYVRRHLGGWRIYHFHDTSSTSLIKSTNDLHDNRFLRPDGANLAAFLYYLRVRHQNEYGLIRDTIQMAAPFFEDFQLEPLALNTDKLRLEWRHRGSDAYFDASSLSDGTLRFIALATLLLQPVELRPSVILLDEPELGLHPYAVTLLASLVQQASVNTQVVLATQSPILLDHFGPDDVLVADRIEGSTQFRQLDPTELRTWLEDYSLGQLWEKNELGGRPARE